MMIRKSIDKSDKQQATKRIEALGAQPKRPIPSSPIQYPLATEHDAAQAAQSAWQSILNNRDQIAHIAMRGEQSGKASPVSVIQPKLTLGPAGDKYEQEADSVAKQVVSNLNNDNGSVTQRQEEEEMMAKRIQRQEEEEMMAKRIQRQEEEEMMAKSNNGTLAGGSLPSALESQIQSARSAGQPIADNTRVSMENAFSADFSDVRVHTGSQSDDLNQSIQARAFTTGQDIFFRSGEYSPSSSSGQKLLAHELTHVVQQNGTKVQRDDKQE